MYVCFARVSRSLSFLFPPLLCFVIDGADGAHDQRYFSSKHDGIQAKVDCKLPESDAIDSVLIVGQSVVTHVDTADPERVHDLEGDREREQERVEER